ncbi:unnamed protein product [Musa banksii]
MTPKLYMVLMWAILLIVYRTTNFQFQHAELETRFHPFDSMKDHKSVSVRVGYLPRGMAQSKSDLELKPLWFSKSHVTKQDNDQSHHNLLAMTVGIKQKLTVDAIVRKFLSENFAIILFHYDGIVNEWHDLWWSHIVIHIAAHSQTKWWFAKRFLHPDTVSIYDYIFLWDEDLGVENFHPGRYLKIMKSEGLEISQPALDPNLSEIHHRITVRKKKRTVHRRVFGTRGTGECSSTSTGPPCTGWVEGMAPVFSRSAWHCAWHLIQNDLIHGWGMDMKLGYCAQGDRTKKVGIVDSEFIVHQGVQTLGGSSAEKPCARAAHMDENLQIIHVNTRDYHENLQIIHVITLDYHIRRRSRSELYLFQERWDQAAREDEGWVDPFRAPKQKKQRPLTSNVP